MIVRRLRVQLYENNNTYDPIELYVFKYTELTRFVCGD